MTRSRVRRVVIAMSVRLATVAVVAEDYETGGPLAGVRLPLCRTHHGELPGFPGCIPELAAEARAKDPRSTAFTPQGQKPELELYPGAVEHWRTYWQHYMPIRSFFDRQSQIRRWTAPDLPGAGKAQAEEYAEPVYWVPTWDEPQFTGRSNKPVPAVRCKVKSPVFRLPLGSLEPGLYVVRWVGAVEMKNMRPFLLPAYVAMEVNDGLQGETSRYRIRIGYCDEFYSIAELYFYAPQKREYAATVWLDDGSTVDVLLHDILLDDVLAGTSSSPVKTRGQVVVAKGSPMADGGPNLRDTWAALPEAERKARTALLTSTTKDARFARDAIIWKATPHPNCQIGFSKLGTDYPNWKSPGRASFSLGIAGRSQEDIEKEYGAWEYEGLVSVLYPTDMPLTDDNLVRLQGFLVNRKLNLKYTLEDLRLGRPLPDPYPYKDTGAGLYTPDTTDPTRGQMFVPIGNGVNCGAPGNGYASAYSGMMWAGTQGWVTNGDEKAARDAAVALIRLAYVFPTLDVSRSLQAVAAHSLWSNIWFGRHRNTSTYVYGNYTAYHNPLYAYDALFDYIRGNQDLAESVSRFVPWVRTPDDLIRLIDVYLVQTTVKRVLRYQWYGSGREPERISEIASLVGNAAATEPWMNWLFSRVFFYPGALGGIQDIIIRGTDRDGRSPIGSFNYMMGEFSADKVAEKLECYIIGGGNPKYDLRDSRRYPKVVSALEFDHRVRTAGIGFPRLGSSSGPDHTSLSGFLPDRAVTGWRWTHDPQFAYVVKHYVGRRDQTDTEWQAIETAAATVSRAPWFENRSRILPNLMVLLETGLAHDDLRFRRSVGVRIGLGQGHHHEDTLDLEMYAHGLPMVLDSGQRRDTAYSTPKDTRSIVHNTVVVDGKNWMGYSWARTVTDAENARYLCAQAVPLNGTRLFRRQVALVDVDEGSYGPDGHSKLGPAQFSPALTSAMPTVVATPSSYVFDVFRVSGGNEHTYCFHGLVTDPAGPQPQTNIETTPISASATSDDKTYRRAAAWLADFKNEKYFATAQAEVQFTFPFPRERPTQTHPFAAVGTEKLLLGAAFDAALPLKFTRLRLLGTDGALAMKGDQHCSRYEHCLPNVFVQRQGQDLESAFCAVIEPYAGTPFIASAQRLAIADNETDARQAVAAALEITTDDRVGRAARRDVCFADGRPEKVRRVQGSGFMLDVAAEFAYLSIDAQGLRQATLSGGTLLDAPGVRIEAATRDRRATVTRADYLAKTVWIDQTWPVWTASARLVELGSLPESGQPGYVTSEMATSARREGAATVLTLLRGADYYRAPITAVDAATGMVVCSGEMPFSAVERSGLLHGFVASNDAQTRFWRADVLPEDKAQARFPFQLRAMTGPPGTAAQAGAVVAADDFGQESVLRLWEYGVGDTVRMNTSVNLRRIGTGEYQVWADVDVVVTVAGKAWSFRAEGLSSAGGSARFRVTP